MPIVIVDRNDNTTEKKVDKGVRNKWNWAWIEKKECAHWKDTAERQNGLTHTVHSMIHSLMQ